MILSDRDIKKQIESGNIVIESPNNDHEVNIGASSLDLRLGHYFKVYNHSRNAVLDPKKPESFKNITSMMELEGENEPFIVQPGEFVLGVTLEKVKIGDDIVARVEGRSSLGRLGIIVHSTAGFVDAGFEGTITLEITNINRMPVALYPGMRVCQLAFEPMTSKADVPYGKKKSSKYQGQILPEESRIDVDLKYSN
ncbi:dCTP deaminase [Pseudomonadota bacterium]